MTVVENDLERCAGPVAPSGHGLAVLRPAGGRAAITDGFWSERQRINREVSLPLGFERLEKVGSFENFRLAAKGRGREYHGQLFSDSDVYKWLEAVAWEQGRAPSAQFEAWQRDCISLIAAAQGEDGYVNTYFQVLQPPEQRFSDLMFGHELYCAGHLMQAAVATQRATGEEALVDVARQLGNHLVRSFGPGRIEGVPGHPEVEMALVELSRLTSAREYRDLAQYFVEARGQRRFGSERYRAAYFQDHVSVRDAETMEGHAVRALYLQCGVADVACECGDGSLIPGLARRWQSMVSTKMYLTGGLGSRGEGESFGDPYELPSDTAYCESCASIASIMWAWRMLLLTGESRFADLIERTMFNAVLAGISLDGSRFAYVNPLQVRPGGETVSGRIPTAGRSEWFETACCPPNLMRMISSWGHYALTCSAEGVQLQQFATGTYDAELFGQQVRMSVATDYPWEGEVRVELLSTPGSEWEFAIRSPSWCEDLDVAVNSMRVAPWLDGGYIRLRRAWEKGDVVTIELQMPVRHTVGHPRVDGVRGAVALERGPLVYCVEEVDLPDDLAVDDVALTSGPARVESSSEPISGRTLRVPAVTVQAEGPLYGQADGASTAASSIDVRAIPYFAWGNRGVGPMRAWLCGDREAPPPRPAKFAHQQQ